MMGAVGVRRRNHKGLGLSVKTTAGLIANETQVLLKTPRVVTKTPISACFVNRFFTNVSLLSCHRSATYDYQGTCGIITYGGYLTSAVHVEHDIGEIEY